MGKRKYSSEEKTAIVLELLKEEKTLSEIASERQVHPNQLRNWRKEFLEKAHKVFEEKKDAKAEERQKQEQEKEKAEMLKLIGQLTLERDFLQKAFKEKNNGRLLR